MSKPPQLTDRELAVSALAALDGNRAKNYKEWLRIGMALHSVDESLLPDWELWSRQSDRYQPGECSVKWNSFGGNGVGIGTLFHLAKQDGWIRPKSTKNGRAASNGHARKKKQLAVDQLKDKRKLGTLEADELLFGMLIDRKPGITFRSLVDAGGIVTKWMNLVCVAFPAYNQRNVAPCTYTLLRNNGEAFPEYKGEKSHLPERKSHNLAGGSDGFILSGGFERLDAAHTFVKCEGVPDFLALSAILPEGYATITNACGATSTAELPYESFEKKTIIVVGDCDETGLKGAHAFADQAAHHAADVRVVRLPYEVVPDHGKDLRDWINEGGTFEQLLTMAESADPVEPAKIQEKKSKPSTTKSNATLPPNLCDGVDDLDPRLPENRTDISNAKRLIKSHGMNLMFCHPWGKFLVFDGSRWKLDDEGLPGCWMQSVVEKLIQDTQRELALAQAAMED